MAELYAKAKVEGVGSKLRMKKSHGYIVNDTIPRWLTTNLRLVER
jgi:hypothetical protein